MSNFDTDIKVTWNESIGIILYDMQFLSLYVDLRHSVRFYIKKKIVIKCKSFVLRHIWVKHVTEKEAKFNLVSVCTD